MAFPFLTANLVVADEIEVIGGTTSGEVEYVLLMNEGEIYVAVGSDHTDRDLEKGSIIKSKQICANVISSEVWRYRDVQSNWDDMLLRSWVRPGADEAEVLYQEARLAAILSARDLIELVQSRMPDRQEDGLVIFSGTVPLQTGKLIYGERFRAELSSPVLEQRLSLGYHVRRLTYLIDADSLLLQQGRREDNEGNSEGNSLTNA